MKRLVSLSVVLVAAIALTSCGGAKSFGKMPEGLSQANGAASVALSCDQEVLTLVKSDVSASVKVTFPADYFNATTIVKVTPVMVFADGEVAEEPVYFQGEKVEDNYTVVTATGGEYSADVVFPYSDEMRLSDLQLRFEFRNAKKETYGYYFVNANTGSLLSSDEDTILTSQPNSKEAIAIRRACGLVVAKGVNTLQEDICYSSLMEEMANDYKAVLTSVSKADLKYAISSSRLNKSALSDAQVVAFKELVEANKANESATQAIYANGYASPDGPEKFNDKLSKARSEAAEKAMSSFLKEMGLEADVASYGEDWDGFKELVAASSIKDKNLILQVLSLYDSSVQREAEIKNLSSVYTELKSDILPELRRAQMINNISIKGMSDDEMMALVAEKNYAELTIEEILHLAESVVKDCAVKADMLSYAAKKYSDARAYNNLGIALSCTGDEAASLKAFDQSTRNGASDVIVNKNLVLSNLENAKYDEAAKYKGDKVSKAAVEAVNGDYTAASKEFKGYNAAIANIMTNNYAAAKAAIKDCKCPNADYLRAVIASAEGDVTNGSSLIKKAIEAKPELAEKAKSDINLSNLFEGGLEL